jgi:hypothetical protein
MQSGRLNPYASGAVQHSSSAAHACIGPPCSLYEPCDGQARTGVGVMRWDCVLLRAGPSSVVLTVVHLLGQAIVLSHPSRMCGPQGGKIGVRHLLYTDSKRCRVIANCLGMTLNSSKRASARPGSNPGLPRAASSPFA